MAGGGAEHLTEVSISLSHSSAPAGRLPGAGFSPLHQSTSAAGKFKLEATYCCPSKYITHLCFTGSNNKAAVQMENC